MGRADRLRRSRQGAGRSGKLRLGLQRGAEDEGQAEDGLAFASGVATSAARSTEVIRRGHIGPARRFLGSMFPNYASGIQASEFGLRIDH